MERNDKSLNEIDIKKVGNMCQTSVEFWKKPVRIYCFYNILLSTEKYCAFQNFDLLERNKQWEHE